MSACNDTPSGLIIKPEKFSYIEAKRGDIQEICANTLLVNGAPFGAAVKRNHVLIDYPSRHAGLGMSFVEFGIRQAWIEQNGTWTNVLSAPVLSGQLAPPFTRPDVTGEQSEEFFQFLNNAFVSNAELSPYFKRAEYRTADVGTVLGTNVGTVYSWGLVTSSAIDNYVLVLSRDDDAAPGANPHSWLLKYDNTAGPVAAAPGSYDWFAQVIDNVNAGDPSVAGWYAGYTGATGYHDPLGTDLTIG